MLASGCPECLIDALGLQAALGIHAPKDGLWLNRQVNNLESLVGPERIEENAKKWRARIEQMVSSDRESAEYLANDLPW